MITKEISNYKSRHGWCHVFDMTSPPETDWLLEENTYRVCRTLQYSGHTPGRRRPGPRASLPRDGWHRALRHRRPPHRHTGRARSDPGHSHASEPVEGRRLQDNCLHRPASSKGASACRFRGRRVGKDWICSRLQGSLWLNLRPDTQPPQAETGQQTPRGSTCDFNPTSNCSWETSLTTSDWPPHFHTLTLDSDEGKGVWHIIVYKVRRSSPATSPEERLKKSQTEKLWVDCKPLKSMWCKEKMIYKVTVKVTNKHVEK